MLFCDLYLKIGISDLLTFFMKNRYERLFIKLVILIISYKTIVLYLGLNIIIILLKISESVIYCNKIQNITSS